MSISRDGTIITNVPSTKSRLLADDIIRTIRQIRKDILEMNEEDDAYFESWLLMNGVDEYKSISEINITNSVKILTDLASEALPNVRPALTKFMKIIWSIRPDLQTAFDIRTPDGQSNFVWWFFIHGFTELKLNLFITDKQRGELNETDSRVPESSFLPISRFMAELWYRRPDLQQDFDLRTQNGRDNYLGWYFTRGILDLNLHCLVDEAQARALMGSTSENPNIAKILSILWRGDATIRAAYSSSSDPLFLLWAKSELAREKYAILKCLPTSDEHDKRAKRSLGVTVSDLPFGVNLIGHARGQFGVGEDVRMAATAMKAMDIPFSIFDVDAGNAADQDDVSALQYVSDELPYRVNIFCTTGMETARIAAKYGSVLFDDRPSIGYWPWEFTAWPAEWGHSFSLVDEVWASSRFTYEAFASSCPKPVRYMPMAVTVDQSAGLTRRDFELPEGHFLFVFSFDYLSTIARKNPGDCVKAFREAFPRGDEPVGLIIKAMRTPDDDAVWQSFVTDAISDSRVIIICGTLSRSELLDLYRACDCYVSLHRSEGFGRNIAEAMMLGKSIIATGYSGNMDFTLPGTAGIVDCRLRPVVDDEYPFAGGLTWAEPDIASAAFWMRRISEDQALRNRLQRMGQQLVAATYDPRVVGQHYRAVLEKWNSARST